jgi:DUF438 domain-containing protein
VVPNWSFFVKVDNTEMMNLSLVHRQEWYDIKIESRDRGYRFFQLLSNSVLEEEE